jgi:hypothetical protein
MFNAGLVFLPDSSYGSPWYAFMKAGVFAVGIGCMLASIRLNKGLAYGKTMATLYLLLVLIIIYVIYLGNF